MNRADRRKAHKTARREHLDCGCVPRLLTPVELVVEHDCGARVHMQTVVMPTAAPVGTLKTLHVMCECGDEVEALHVVGTL